MSITNISGHPAVFPFQLPTFTAFPLARLQSSVLCDKLENLWQSQKYQLEPLLQFIRCEKGACILDANGKVSISYLRHDVGCVIRMDNKYADTKAEFSMIGDIQSFLMAMPGRSLRGRTDYKNFIEAGWESTASQTVFNAARYHTYTDILNTGSLKVERVNSGNLEIFKIELVNKNGDAETRFSADCCMGQNEVFCETVEGDLFTNLFTGNKISVFVTKQKDAETGIETLKFKMQTQPWFWLVQPRDLGEFVVKFDPSGEFFVQGNVLLPGSTDPLFVGNLNCKNALRSCSGNAILASSNIHRWGNSSAQHNLTFEYTPTTYSQFIQNKQKTTMDDREYNSNMLQHWHLSDTRTGEDRMWELRHEQRSETESSFHPKPSVSHVLSEFRMKDAPDGINAMLFSKDLSNPDAEKTLLQGAYHYDHSNPNVDIYEARLQTIEGLEAEAKAKMPKKIPPIRNG